MCRATKNLFGRGSIHGLLHVIGGEKSSHDCVEITPDPKHLQTLSEMQFKFKYVTNNVHKR